MCCAENFVQKTKSCILVTQSIGNLYVGDYFIVSSEKISNETTSNLGIYNAFRFCAFLWLILLAV